MLEKLEHNIYFENVVEKPEKDIIFLLLRWKNWKINNHESVLSYFRF